MTECRGERRDLGRCFNPLYRGVLIVTPRISLFRCPGLRFNPLYRGVLIVTILVIFGRLEPIGVSILFIEVF